MFFYIAVFYTHLVVSVPGCKVSDENDGEVQQVRDVVRLAVPQQVGGDVPELQRDALLTQNLLLKISQRFE